MRGCRDGNGGRCYHTSSTVQRSPDKAIAVLCANGDIKWHDGTEWGEYFPDDPESSMEKSMKNAGNKDKDRKSGKKEKKDKKEKGKEGRGRRKGGRKKEIEKRR